MANKTRLSGLLRPTPQAQPAPRNEEAEDEQSIDDRFREAIRLGKTSGDFVVLDEHGDEIVGAFPSKSIFDV